MAPWRRARRARSVSICSAAAVERATAQRQSVVANGIALNVEHRRRDLHRRRLSLCKALRVRCIRRAARSEHVQRLDRGNLATYAWADGRRPAEHLRYNTHPGPEPETGSTWAESTRVAACAPASLWRSRVATQASECSGSLRIVCL